MTSFERCYRYYFTEKTSPKLMSQDFFILDPSQSKFLPMPMSRKVSEINKQEMKYQLQQDWCFFKLPICHRLLL